VRCLREEINRDGEGGKKEKERKKKVRRVSGKLHCPYNAVPLNALRALGAVASNASIKPPSPFPMHRNPYICDMTPA